MKQRFIFCATILNWKSHWHSMVEFTSWWCLSNYKDGHALDDDDATYVQEEREKIE